MKILHISCGYLPGNIGGTEIYVHSLSTELYRRGHEVFIHYIDTFSEKNEPLVRTKEYLYGGLPVYVIEKNIYNQDVKKLYFEPSEGIQDAFRGYLARIKPQVIHFHHFSPTDVLTQIKAARELRIPVLLTYHTPMMTCGRQDLLYLGKKICDGRIDSKKCLICGQHKYGIPLPIAYLWANFPFGLSYALGKCIAGLNLRGRIFTWFEFPRLINERIKKWKEAFALIDRYIALSQWGYELLIKNDLPKKSLSLCRQGINHTPKKKEGHSNGLLRLGYVGRIHPVKGIDLLLRALKNIPSNYVFELNIYGVCGSQRDELEYYERLLKLSLGDKRIKWKGPLSENNKYEALSEMDALIIPSLWMETGPLVLLESWVSGTPVIASGSGAMPELIKDGCGGILFKARDSADLARVIRLIFDKREVLRDMRGKIPEVRRIEEVAKDMESLYEECIWKKI